METQSWTTMDKTGWGPGPWQDEPDKLQYADEATGLPCLIKRNRSGALCGYVGVTEGHPWFQKDYDDVDPYPAVHGGLTFADSCQEGDESETICHIPGPGEPDNVWWLGFDCAHAGDMWPGFGSMPFPGDTYKTLAYVQGECASLAEQAVKAADA